MSEPKRETLKVGNHEIPVIVDDLMPPGKWMFLQPEQAERYLKARQSLEYLRKMTNEFFEYNARPSPFKK